MMIYRALLLLTATSVVVNATWELPFSGQCRLLDQLVERSHQPILTLTVLKRVALGRTTQITPQEERLVGLPEGVLRDSEFAESIVRACAFRRIGELDLDEARTFLANLSRKDIGTDTTHEIWTAAQIALRNAFLISLTSNAEKRLFLEKVLTEPHNGVAALWSWAVDELCDRGEMLSIGVIQRSIRWSYAGSQKDAEGEIAFCEERIRVIAQRPERLKALGSVLNATTNPGDRLVRWAINQLAVMRTPAADAELMRFAAEIDGVPPGSERRRHLAKYKTIVDRSLRIRAASQKQK